MTRIIAHRGLRNEFPENTIEAISHALSLPLHGVEFDVELTADGVPVVLHQETLVPDSAFTRLELATRDYVSRDWAIERSLEEIRALDAGSWMGQRFKNLRIPTMEEVLGLNWSSVAECVELKDATYWRESRDINRPKLVVDAVLPSLRSFKGSINVISFNPEILRLISERAPGVGKTLALWTEWQSRIPEAIAEAIRCGAEAISLPDTVVLAEPDWVTAAHRSNIELHVYPVSPARGEPEFNDWTAESQSQKWKQLRDLKVDAILSDFARESVESA
jgi:glycerophosphoryl diester phosphodiesterase